MSRRTLRRNSRAYSSPVFPIFVGLLLAAASIPFISGSDDWPAEVTDVKTLDVFELKSGMAVYIEDAVLMDRYAHTTENGRTKSTQCALGFAMKDGKKAIASLQVPSSGKVYQLMTDYLNDESQQIGDCHLTMYATVSSLGTQFMDYLNEYVTKVFGQLSEYRVVTKTLTMRAETAEEYAAARAREARNNRLMGAGLLALSLLLIGLGVNNGVKRRAAKRAAAEQAEREAAAQADPAESAPAQENNGNLSAGR